MTFITGIYFSESRKVIIHRNNQSGIKSNIGYSGYHTAHQIVKHYISNLCIIFIVYPARVGRIHPVRVCRTSADVTDYDAFRHNLIISCRSYHCCGIIVKSAYIRRYHHIFKFNSLRCSFMCVCRNKRFRFLRFGFINIKAVFRYSANFITVCI